MKQFLSQFRVISLAVLVAAMVTGQTRSTQAEGKLLTPSQTPFYFYFIKMFSATNGWAQVRHTISSVPDGRKDVSYLLHTRDGGKTWDGFYTPTNDPDADIIVLNDTHILSLSNDPSDSSDDANVHRLIWRSLDGGRSWKKSPNKINLTDHTAGYYLSFADPSHGWLLAQHSEVMSQEPALLLQTSDGGLTWTPIADTGFDNNETMGGLSPTLHTGMAFATSRLGWMTLYSAATEQGWLEQTDDGGRNWHGVDLSAPGGYDGFSSCTISNPTVFGPTILALSVYCKSAKGGEPPMYLYLTKDGGLHWKVVELPENTLSFGFFMPYNPQVNMINPMVGLLIGFKPKDSASATQAPTASPDEQQIQPVLYWTHDGGTSWVETAPIPDILGTLEPGTQTDFTDQFEFIDDHTGWAINSQSGSLLATRDAGKTWVPVDPVIHWQ